MNTPTIMNKVVEIIEYWLIWQKNFYKYFIHNFFILFWTHSHPSNELFLDYLTLQLILEIRSKDILVLSLIIYPFAKRKLDLNQKFLIWIVFKFIILWEILTSNKVTSKILED